MIFMLTSERERPAMSPHLCARNVKPTARSVIRLCQRRGQFDEGLTDPPLRAQDISPIKKPRVRFWQILFGRFGDNVHAQPRPIPNRDLAVFDDLIR